MKIYQQNCNFKFYISFMDISRLYTYQKIQFKGDKTVAFFELRWTSISSQVCLLNGYPERKTVRVV